MNQPLAAPLAIVGMACRYPDARSPGELWENVLSRRQAFRRIPSERLRAESYLSRDRSLPDLSYVVRAAVIEGYEFDRARFRIPPSTFAMVDPTHWLALDVAAGALADAGFPEGRGLPRDRTGVLVGNSLAGEFSRANVLRLRWPYVARVVDSQLAERGSSPAERREFLEALEIKFKGPFPAVGDETLAGGLSNTIAGRICNYFDLHGGGYTVDGACSSSLLAVANACSALTAGDLDVVIAGGVDLSLDPFELVGFARLGALAEEEMRVYDAHPTGFLPGEGCGMLVLMRQADALEQGRTLHALVRGWGISSDGQGGLTRPEPRGQLLALRSAYERAGYGVGSVAYFEGHGTGTEIGDAVELRTLSAALRESAAAPGREALAGPSPAIGSIKCNIGHTKAAAGAAGLIKAALAVAHGILPPTTGCREPHPELCGEAPALRVLEDPEPWPEDRPARAGVSSMGFGGINVHVALEGATGKGGGGLASGRARFSPRSLGSPPQDAEVFLFAGEDRGDLLRRIRKVLSYADRLSLSEMTDLAAALEKDLPPAGAEKAAAVASSPRQLAERLQSLASSMEGKSGSRIDPRSGVFLASSSEAPRIGLLFPGQASPSYSSGGALALRFSFVRELYRRAPIPAAGDPGATGTAQPAIVTASLAALCALEKLGISAGVAIGHSVGELVALHWAGAYGEGALLDLAAVRGKLMADLGRPGGSMAAVGAGRADVEALLPGEAVVIAGANSPRQTVISGEAAAVRRVCDRAAQRGLSATVLPVSHAFHSRLMEPVKPAFREKLRAEAFKPLSRRVASTITGAFLGPGEDVKDLLLRQLTSPVCFIEALAAATPEVDLWIEAGPGHVLAGLVASQAPTPVVAMDAGGPSLEGLLSAVSAAFVLGAPVDRGSLFGDRFARPFPLDWRPRFFASPCEGAPVSAVVERMASASPRAVAAGAKGAAGAAEPQAAPAISRAASPMDIVRELVSRKLQLPVEEIEAGSRLLGDLHLNSITVRDIVATAARHLGLEPPRTLTEHAGATVGELAAFLGELAASPRARKPEGPPAGVAEWTEAFAVQWTERARRERQAPPAGGGWRVLGPPGLGPRDAALLEGLTRAFDAMREGGGVVVYLPEEPDRPAIRVLLEGARAVLRGGKESAFVLVHQGVGAAFAKTLLLESPGRTVCAVEVPPDSLDAASWVAAEARAANGFVESRYDRSGRRWEPFLRKHPPRDPQGEVRRETILGPEDVLLATGGGKGITAECALALARRTGARLALVGRSRPDGDSALAASLKRMADLGVRLEYFAADVTDARALAEAVRGAESKLGKITAILHGAGSNSPKLIELLDEESFLATLAPKVTGLRNLLSAVDADGLRLLVTFGSIIARMGLPGEADYALANEWLALLTERFQAEHPRCRTAALEWSVWAGIGMGERLGRVEALLEEGVAPITPERGIALLEDLVSRQLPSASVVVTGRFGEPPTLKLERVELPLLRFVEKPRIHYPGVELVLDAELSTEKDPYVADHEYAGEQVFPAVFTLEAMAQAARALTGEEGLPSFEKVRFQRAVLVPRTGSVTVRLAALARGSGRVEVVLRSEETGFQADHAAAVCCFGPRSPARAGDSLRDESLDGYLPLDPERDLYGRLLFHRGRFRRLRGYRKLRAKACVAETTREGRADWFGRLVPGKLLLGDPAARDAAVHAIQACIPHARLLPVGAERIVPGLLEAGRAYTISAREVLRRGDEFVYDVLILAEDGSAVERWEGLMLRKVEGIRAPSPWPAALLAPYLQRRLEELVPCSIASVALRRGDADDRALRTKRALDACLGEPVQVTHRCDGKAEVVTGSAVPGPEGGPGPDLDSSLMEICGREPAIAAGRSVSVAHADGLTLAVACRGPMGCDMEVAGGREASSWRDVLGPERFRLAGFLSRQSGEDIGVAASRVWTAAECLKKAGLTPDAPLVFDSAAEDGWVLLKSGRLSAASYVASVEGSEQPLAIAVLLPADDQSV